MKTKIKFFYDLSIEQISEHQNFFVIISQNKIYILKKLYDTDENFIAMYNFIKQQKDDYMEIVSNRENQPITEIEKNKYVLMLIKNSQKNKDVDFDIIDSNYMNDNLTSDLWIKKVDYYKEQISNFGYGKSELLCSFNYFSGLAENAIQLVLLAEKNNINGKKFITHKRIYYPNYYINYYDPTNLTIDYYVRDIAGYIKSYYFESEFHDIKKIRGILKQNIRTENDLLITYARVLYPTYYFDIFEDYIISENIENEAIKQKVNKIVIKSKEYLQYIRDVFKEYLDYNVIPKIEWLNNL